MPKRVCRRCLLPKEAAEAFAIQHSNPYADGSVRYRSNCRDCENEVHREGSRRRAEEEITTKLAPQAAAIRLISEDPNIMADVIRRNLPRYTQLLAQEREKMLVRRRLFVSRQRRAKAKGKGTNESDNTRAVA